MRALVVMRSLPRQGTGDAGRGHQLLRVLRDVGIDVHLVCLLGAGQRASDVEELKRLCRWPHVFERANAPGLRGLKTLVSDRARLLEEAIHPGMAAKIAELADKVGLAICMDAVHHELLRPIWSRAPQAGGVRERPYILDLGTPLSERLVLDAEARGGVRGWFMRSAGAESRVMESNAAAVADLTLVSDPVSLQLLSQRAKTARLWSVGTGVELRDAPSAAGYGDLPDSIAFLGDLSIAAHQRAAIWLAKTVLPLVQQVRDHAVLRITGSELPTSILKLARLKGVQVNDVTQSGHGISAAILQSPVAVAPQRDARGATDWALMAMACGRPVVATTAVASGLPGESAMGPIRADRADAISDAVIKLLRNRADAHQQGRRGREMVDQSGTCVVQWRRLKTTLFALANGEAIPSLQSEPTSRTMSAGTTRPSAMQKV